MTWPARRKGVINLVEAGVDLKQVLVWTVNCLSGGKISSEAARQSSQERSQVKKEERHNIRVETENVNNVALILEWWASFLGSHVNDVTLAGFTSLSWIWKCQQLSFSSPPLLCLFFSTRVKPSGRARRSGSLGMMEGLEICTGTLQTPCEMNMMLVMLMLDLEHLKPCASDQFDPIRIHPNPPASRFLLLLKGRVKKHALHLVPTHPPLSMQKLLI